MKTGFLFFVVVASAIVVLLLGSETVRWLMAGAVAVPLWVSMQRENISKGIARAADVIRGRRESS
jgi:p-aminobenzoyl-glutamate transporter AbgT